MRHWLVSFCCLLLVVGCAKRLGAVHIIIELAESDPTRCLRVSATSSSGASVSSQPNIIERNGQNTLDVGLSETTELTGEVTVLVRRFTSADCSGRAIDTTSRAVTLERGTKSDLRFDYRDGPDAGVDGGVDGGCDEMMCPARGPCDGVSIGCCQYAALDAGTPCGDAGACNAQRACQPECIVLPTGASCSGGLSCLSNKVCSGQSCSGACAGSVPECQNLSSEACTPDGLSCVARPDLMLNNNGCGMGGQNQCRFGACLKWLPYTPPATMRTRLSDLPEYPDGGWSIGVTSPCTVDIDTDDDVGTKSECASLPIFSTIDDAGVRVFVVNGLEVGQSGRLNFYGNRPAQLIVLGDATITGVIGVVPSLTRLPSGANQTQWCGDGGVGGDGTMNAQGAGGGALGDLGGPGGNDGGNGGTVTFPLEANLLRGGCNGGTGMGVNAGGMAGGALSIFVSDTLRVIDGGVISASANGGAGARAPAQGAGGGGSGGMIYLMARVVDLERGAVTANGGNGGAGGISPNPVNNGLPGSLTSASAPDASVTQGGGSGGVGGVATNPRGSAGGDSDAGPNAPGGGGGGSIGIVIIRSIDSCHTGSGVVSGAVAGIPEPCVN